MILSDIEQRIKAKIEAIGTPLKDWDISINYGIKTGFNDAFIIDGKKRAELIAQDPKSEEIIRPILRGRDIKRYGYEFADLYLLFIPWHFPFHLLKPEIKGASQEAEEVFKSQYPAIYNHLLQYKTELSNRNKSETGIRYEWYALQRWGANYWEDFSKPKIIYQELTQGSSFYLDKDSQFWVSNTGYLITGKNLEYLILFLNSKIIEFVFKKFYSVSLGSTGIRWLAQCIENLPIPFVKDTDYEKLKTEEEIEKYVGLAYNLSQEEINLITNK